MLNKQFVVCRKYRKSITKNITHQDKFIKGKSIINAAWTILSYGTNGNFTVELVTPDERISFGSTKPKFYDTVVHIEGFTLFQWRYICLPILSIVNRVKLPY